jgi:hypothetical protein
LPARPLNRVEEALFCHPQIGAGSARQDFPSDAQGLRHIEVTTVSFNESHSFVNGRQGGFMLLQVVQPFGQGVDEYAGPHFVAVGMNGLQAIAQQLDANVGPSSLDLYLAPQPRGDRHVRRL